MLYFKRLVGFTGASLLGLCAMTGPVFAATATPTQSQNVQHSSQGTISSTNGLDRSNVTPEKGQINVTFPLNPLVGTPAIGQISFTSNKSIWTGSITAYWGDGTATPYNIQFAGTSDKFKVSHIYDSVGEFNMYAAMNAWTELHQPVAAKSTPIPVTPVEPS